jgi:uncharacterized protein YfaT (DUF1175 family)
MEHGGEGEMRTLLVILAAAAAALFAIARVGHSPAKSLVVEVTPARLPANGYAAASLKASVPAIFSIVEGQRAGRIEGSRLIAGALGGRIVVEARAAGYRPVRAVVETEPQPPEVFLTLDEQSDRDAFTGWFTFLAEAQYFTPELPPEVMDCAALIRFAYRESFREHDGHWASALKLTSVPPLPGVRKYVYPYTPLGANLFRTGDGYAEFADAQTLIRHNTFFVSRDIGSARPGDLLFYRQLDAAQPFHTMIFLGRSRFEPGAEEFVVYHTGPIHKQPGEIRRPSVEELLRHPAPQWRPQAGNPNFLGIYRWNILRRS